MARGAVVAPRRTSSGLGGGVLRVGGPGGRRSQWGQAASAAGKRLPSDTTRARRRGVQRV